jgi:hypothetical protein
MNTIILHIGYPKTGTSSLQWFLHTHRETLRRQGVCYPLTGQADDHAHHRLAFSLGANAAEGGSAGESTKLFTALRREIDESGADTVLLSSEVFLGNLHHLQASDDFASLLDGRTLRLICFVRRQATFLESLYRQFIWDPEIRFAGNPDAFLEAYPVAGEYHGPLSVWNAWIRPSKIEIVVYEQALVRGGCIREFCRRVGVDVSGLPEADFEVRRNIGVASAAATELMRAANGYRLSADERVEFARRARQFSESTRELPLPRALFSAEDIARIEARYLESNRKLADEFVKQPLDGAWFRETAGP